MSRRQHALTGDESNIRRPRINMHSSLECVHIRDASGFAYIPGIHI